MSQADASDLLDMGLAQGQCSQVSAQSVSGKKDCAVGGAMAAALTAAQMTVKEILEGSTQRDLLAYARALPGASKSTRKQDLVSNLMDFCDDVSHKQSTCTDLLAGHGVRDLRRLIARLRGLGCLVRLGQKPRRNDLVAAIASVDEYAPSSNPGPSTGLSRRKGLCLSAGSVGSAEKPSAIKEGAGPQESMALVAYDTAADPGKLQRKLTKRWGKRCARFLKRAARKEKLAARKEKLANLDTVLQRVLQDHGETTTIGELRAMVGRAVGVTLEGKYRAPFDKAWSKLTAPPPTQPRARCRFNIANKRAKHDKTRNA